MLGQARQAIEASGCRLRGSITSLNVIWMGFMDTLDSSFHIPP